MLVIFLARRHSSVVRRVLRSRTERIGAGEPVMKEGPVAETVEER